jgi:hypothetical protein
MEPTNEDIIALTERESVLHLVDGNGMPLKPKSLFKKCSRTQVETILNWLRRRDHEVMPLIAHLLTTGTAVGQELVIQNIVEHIATAAAALEEGTKEEDQLWDVELRSPEVFRSGLLQDWCIGNISAECNLSLNMLDLLGLMTASRFIDNWRKREKPNLPVRTDVTYWRAVTALAATEAVQYYGGMPNKDQTDFLAWAGDQPNLPEIVTFVRERDGLLNVDAIVGIMEQSGVIGTLREGVV